MWWGKYLPAPYLSAKGLGAWAIHRCWLQTRAMQVELLIGNPSIPDWKPSLRTLGIGIRQAIERSRPPLYLLCIPRKRERRNSHLQIRSAGASRHPLNSVYKNYRVGKECLAYMRTAKHA
jgi:hypothetical protein